MYNDKRFNDPADLLPVNKNPVGHLPGYYYCPLDERLCVNNFGEIKNVKTGKTIKPIVNKSTGTCFIGITSPGIKYKARTAHRMIASTMVGKPSRHALRDFSELEVNHIDGDRANNHPDNLEWVTSSENVIHAHETELSKQREELEVYDIRKGYAKKYKGYRETAKLVDIPFQTFYKHINSNKAGRVNYNGYAFRRPSNDPWSLVFEERKVNSTYLVQHKATGDVVHYSKLKDVAEQCRISYNRLSEKMSEVDKLDYKEYIIYRYVPLNRQIPENIS